VDVVITLQLAKLLAEKGWSPYRLAKESGIPQPTVYRLLDESDRDVRISLRTLDALVRTLKCKVGDLLVYQPTGRAR
jgi:DNA-binding Xre family transcriptional regulator